MGGGRRGRQEELSGAMRWSAWEGKETERDGDVLWQPQPQQPPLFSSELPPCPASTASDVDSSRALEVAEKVVGR
jgi:hypothetical protein